MLCEICRGSPIAGMVVAEISGDPDGRPQVMYVPCPNGCIGGVASCCDGAGSQQPEPPPVDAILQRTR